MKHALLIAAALATTLTLPAQNTGYQGPIPEFGSFNTFRVVSGTHSTTGNRLPVATTEPPGYSAAPGVVAGTRCWVHTPLLRGQASAQGTHWLTVEGATHAIFAGPCVTTYPAPNHYQFMTGIAPAAASATPPVYTHATTGPDIFSIAAAPVAINQPGIFEHSVTLTTPVVIQQASELVLFVEYTGGEWRDDPNGGQTIASDYLGGLGPGRLRYVGWTTGVNPRTLVLFSERAHRAKIGILISEPVLTATGFHANTHVQPPLAGEEYRGVTAARGDWAAQANGPGSLFFNVRAGGKYGSGGTCVVFVNFSPLWWPGSLPIGGYGNFLLDPVDPALSLFTGLPLLLKTNGIYNDGDQNSLAVPALGSAAIGTILKAQGLVFNPGFLDIALTTSSGIKIEL